MTTTTSHGTVTTAQNTRADYTTLRLGLWSVCVYAGLGLLGFAVFAGFWPPPGQDLDASAITR
jgi:hypothetical protein